MKVNVSQTDQVIAARHTAYTWARRSSASVCPSV